MLELAVRVYVHRVAVIGQRRKRILAQIEACDPGGFFRSPMSGTRIAVLAFVNFRAGGCEAQLARPMKRELITGERSRVAQMWIPAFARSDKQNAIPGIANDVAVIANCELDVVTC